MVTPERNSTLTVFYDGACPLCTREIAFYRRRRGANRIVWIDVSESPETNPELPNAEIRHGLCRRAALERFHVRHADGRVITGGRAFAELWVALPGLAFPGRLFRVWPLCILIDVAYELFLPLRPFLQRLIRYWVIRK